LKYLLALALVLRVGYALHLHQGTGGRNLDFWDSEGYDRMGQRWLDTGTFSDELGRPMTDREPFYPLLLASAHAVLGRSYVVALALNAALGLAACWLVFLLTRTLFDEEAALWALGFAALYPEWIYYSAFVYRETLLAVLTLWWLHLWAAGGSFALMGLIFGAACVTRSPMIPLGGVFLLFARSRRVAAFLACALLVNGIWIARNYKATGRFVAGASMGGLTMYMSLLKDYDKPEEAIEQNLYHTDDPVLAEAQRAPTAAAADQVYYRACRRIMREQPGRFWGAFFRKGIKLWRPYPSPNRDYKHAFSVLKWIGLLSNGPILLLSWAGLWLAWKRRAPVGFLLSIPLVMTIVFAAYWSTTRYRAPLMGCLFPLAGLAVARRREIGFH
jgi:hypothetical protein